MRRCTHAIDGHAVRPDYEGVCTQHPQYGARQDVAVHVRTANAGMYVPPVCVGAESTSGLLAFGMRL